jgi:hypothetical protein
VKLGADEPIGARSPAIAIVGESAIKQASATLNPNTVARELSMNYLLAEKSLTANLPLGAMLTCLCGWIVMILSLIAGSLDLVLTSSSR